MNENDPQAEPSIQMTPVGFAPAQTPDAIGSSGAPPPRPELRFTFFLPVFIILVTLIFSTVRDIIALNKRMTTINEENVPGLELLKKSGQQIEFVQSLRTDLWNLAPSDPVAARVAMEMFPKSLAPKPDAKAAPAPKPADQPAPPAKTPAK